MMQSFPHRGSSQAALDHSSLLGRADWFVGWLRFHVNSRHTHRWQAWNTTRLNKLSFPTDLTKTLDWHVTKSGSVKLVVSSNCADTVLPSELHYCWGQEKSGTAACVYEPATSGTLPGECGIEGLGALICMVEVYASAADNLRWRTLPSWNGSRIITGWGVSGCDTTMPVGALTPDGWGLTAVPCWGWVCTAEAMFCGSNWGGTPGLGFTGILAKWSELAETSCREPCRLRVGVPGLTGELPTGVPVGVTDCWGWEYCAAGGHGSALESHFSIFGMRMLADINPICR